MSAQAGRPGVAGRTAGPPIALYPIGLALVLLLELLNVAGVSPFTAGRPFLLVVAGAALLAWIGRLVLGDRDRGGVFAAIWVLAMMGSEDLRLTLAIALATVLLLLERYAISPDRQTIRWARIGRIASWLVAIFGLAVLIQGAQVGWFGVAARAAREETPIRPSPTLAATGSSDPDIYMLLLDGHTRADVLAQVFGRDETGFVDTLEEDGYFVAPRSRSNYTQTAPTLMSMFEQQQLQDIPAVAGLLEGNEQETPGAVVGALLNDNPTWTFLRGRGYQVDTVSSGFEQVTIRSADRFVDTGQLNELEIALLKRSLVGQIVERVAPDAVSAQQRDRIRGVFDAFATAPEWIGSGPQFVFAHVPSPHPPWVFHADGSPRTVSFREDWLAETPASTGLTDAELRTGYGDQVVDSDRRALEALTRLDAAIAARGRPAVIIVFADHGTWIGADGGDIRLRFKNLLAVKGTGVSVDVAPNQTLVNLLPSLFHQLFGTEFTPRPDTEYRFGTDDAYNLTPVDDPDEESTP